MYVLYTRRPEPNKDHLLRLDVFFVGLLVFASVLMLRQPLFFIFMIAGFFYATVLRPLPLAVVGVAASSILVNTLIAGFPQTSDGVDLVPRDHHRPDRRDQRRRGLRREGHRAERGTPRGARPAGGGARGERRPPRPAADPGPRGGRPRRAAADGTRDPRHDRAGVDRDHHPARGGRPHEGSAGRPGSPHRERQAARPREPDRGAPLGRGVDARRARGRDAPRRARRGRTRVVRAQRHPGRGDDHRRGDRPPSRDRGRAAADRPGGPRQRRQARRCEPGVADADVHGRRRHPRRPRRRLRVSAPRSAVPRTAPGSV